MRNGFAGTAHNGIIYDTLGRQGIDDAGGWHRRPARGCRERGFQEPRQRRRRTDPGPRRDLQQRHHDSRAWDSPRTTSVNVFGSGNIGCNGVNDADFALVAETTSFTPTGVCREARFVARHHRPATGQHHRDDDGVGSAGSARHDGDLRRCLRAVPGAALADGWTALGQAGMLPEPGSMSTLAAGAVLLMLLKRRR